MPKNYFSSDKSKKKNILIYIAVFILIVFLGIGVYFVQQEGVFETRQYASEFNADGTPVSYIDDDGDPTYIEVDNDDLVISDISDDDFTEITDLEIIGDNSSDIDTDGDPTYIEPDFDPPAYIIENPIISNISEGDFTLVTDDLEDVVTISENTEESVSNVLQIIIDLEVVTDDSSDVSVSIYEPGNKTAVLSESVVSNSAGEISNIDISDLSSKEYLLIVKPEYYLSQSVEIDLSSGENFNVVFENEFKVGDFYEDNVINAKDISFLNKYYFQANEEYDVNGDSRINATDMTVLIQNWFQVGS